jgi:hypothetical protein
LNLSTKEKKRQLNLFKLFFLVHSIDLKLRIHRRLRRQNETPAVAIQELLEQLKRGWHITWKLIALIFHGVPGKPNDTTDLDREMSIIRAKKIGSATPKGGKEHGGNKPTT